LFLRRYEELYGRLGILGGIVNLRYIGDGVANYVYQCAVMNIIRIYKAINTLKYVPVMRSQEIIDVPIEPTERKVFLRRGEVRGFQ
jgi:hypothetical protein